MLVASIVGIIVTLLDVPVNFLFEMLASPTTSVSNEIKSSAAWGARQATAAASAVVRTARRASSVTVEAAHSLAGRRVGRSGDTSGSDTVASHRRKFSFIHEEATYTIGHDVLGKRHSIVGSVEDALLRSEEAAPTGAPSVATYILNSEFFERKIAARRTLIKRRSELFAGETGSEISACQGDGGLTSLTTDLSLHLEALRATDIDGSVGFMQQWNYAVVLPKHLRAYGPALTEQEERIFVEAEGRHEELKLINREALGAELELVQREASSKLESLVFSGEAVLGMSILHEFILDILGRDSPQGKIFVRKAHVDFCHMHVVSMVTKVGACCLIICINIFCLFYAILKGFSKGVSWQQHFLIASTLQLLVEILIFETIEVLWSNVAVPQFVVAEVNSACVEVLATINKFAEDAQEDAGAGASAGATASALLKPVTVFNASDYFFISKELARARPGNIESKIISRFESTAPTRGLKKRFGHKFGHEDEEGGLMDAELTWGHRFLRWLRYASTTAALLLVQMSANMPTALQ